MLLRHSNNASVDDEEKVEQAQAGLFVMILIASEDVVVG